MNSQYLHKFSTLSTLKFFIIRIFYSVNHHGKISSVPLYFYRQLHDNAVAHLRIGARHGIDGVFGAGGLMDAFLVAFKIPNFLRRLFAEGAFSQAFVPVLSEYKENAL